VDQENQSVSNCTVDNPEQRQIKGVQGGSTVQPKDFALEKSTVAVLEKIAPEISSTSISSGGQRAGHPGQKSQNRQQKSRNLILNRSSKHTLG
jgi:hypothetical protein